ASARPTAAPSCAWTAASSRCDERADPFPCGATARRSIAGRAMSGPTPAFLDEALGHARAAADAAEAVIARYYRHRLQVETKADQSPVTEADRECEREIKRVLQAAYPDHGYYGEEYGRERAQ